MGAATGTPGADLGVVLYEPGATMTHFYLQNTSIGSMLYVVKGGESAEVAVVDLKGLVRVPLSLGKC